MLWMGKSYHCALNKSFICHNWNGYFVSVSQKYLAARTEKTKFHNFCLLDHFYVIMPFGSNVLTTQKRSIMFLVVYNWKTWVSVCLYECLYKIWQQPLEELSGGLTSRDFRSTGRWLGAVIRRLIVPTLTPDLLCLIMRNRS